MRLKQEQVASISAVSKGKDVFIMAIDRIWQVRVLRDDTVRNGFQTAWEGLTTNQGSIAPVLVYTWFLWDLV